MPKKSFKDSPALAFIGNPKATEAAKIPDMRTGFPMMEHAENIDGQKYYRINLKLKAEYKDYLEWVSWKNKKSITQYINDLIEADKETP
jgi:hypothetical protein